MKKIKRQSGPALKSRAAIVRKKPFSLEALLKHIDPGPRGETEKFVRLIYEERRRDAERSSA